MTKRIMIAMLVMGLTSTAGRSIMAAPDAKALAQKGYNLFKDVIAGDEAKLPEAIRYMEEARDADGTDVPNLYNLARAYFFEGITFNRGEAIAEAEKTFARTIELDAGRTDAMAFHGAILAQMSGGKDMALFMRGAQEMKTAIERTPDDVTVRLILAFAAQIVPPQAHALMGVSDTVHDLTFVGNIFAGFSSDFAPHAALVMDAFIGEAQLSAGDKNSAQTSFERALKTPEPSDAGQLAGRKVLERVIVERMNGGGTSIFQNPNFSGCHSCHLGAPDKLLSAK
jgi:tetratricopeptide (TPR) repeat protein